jgi:hypothetical protein
MGRDVCQSVCPCTPLADTWDMHYQGRPASPAANLMSVKNCVARLVCSYLAVWWPLGMTPGVVAPCRLFVMLLQAGTSVYILTIAFVTSILPSGFGEIAAIVGVIGCDSGDLPKIRGCHFCGVKPGDHRVSASIGTCITLEILRKPSSLLCAGTCPWTLCSRCCCTTRHANHGGRGGRRTSSAA